MSKEKQCRWKPEDWDRIFGDECAKSEDDEVLDEKIANVFKGSDNPISVSLLFERLIVIENRLFLL